MEKIFREKPGESSINAVKRARMQADAENRPVRILFVCLGNICRSPAAEGIMRHITKDLPASLRPELDSAGFYGGHAGDLPDRRMRHAAFARGLRLEHQSRVIRPSDFDYFDLILGMDDQNIDNLHEAAPTLDAEKKIARMSDFAVHYPEADSVPDPYWEGAAGFEIVLNLLEDGCDELAKQLGLKE